MASIALTSFTPPVANLQQYLRAVESYPVLREDEERELARRLKRDNDLDAAWQLVRSHLRYVVRIARSYRGYGLPQEDLIQEGNIGLMKAVKRFDPSYGVRLLAYATYWIRAAIHDFIHRNWRIVRLGMTKSKRKLFYKLRGAKERLDWLTEKEAAKVASDLEVKADDVTDMEARLYLTDVSFDGSVATPEESRSPAQYLQDSQFAPDTFVEESDLLDKASSALVAALAELDTRSREIIENRWLAEDEERATLSELGKRYGISAERVRQIETAAIRQIREFVLPRVGIDSNAELDLNASPRADRRVAPIGHTC